MSDLIQPGTPAPEFALATEDGDTFTQDSLQGQTTVLVFYPFAFSPVCTDQLQIYEEAPEEVLAGEARAVGPLQRELRRRRPRRDDAHRRRPSSRMSSR